MNEAEISALLYSELNESYCYNCRYDSECSDSDPNYGCDICHRKSMGWAVSRATCDCIAHKIGGES